MNFKPNALLLHRTLVVTCCTMILFGSLCIWFFSSMNDSNIVNGDSKNSDSGNGSSPTIPLIEHTWFVVDGEMDGPQVGKNSLISLGLVACSETAIVDSFEINIAPLENGVQDPVTMEFWDSISDIYASVTKDPIEPKTAMRRIQRWVASFPGEPVFVGCPMGFDFRWVDWYQREFLPTPIFNHYAFDIITAVHLLWGFSWTKSRRSAWPPEWLGDTHDHTALSDALGYARVFLALKERHRGLISAISSVHS